MRYMHKIYSELNPSDFNDCYQSRLAFDSTYLLDINIKPMDQPNEYELYFIPTTEMMLKLTKAYKVSKRLEDIYEHLPDVAKEQFVMECIVDELYNTNELEGVKSSKEEIARSARELKLNKKSKARFHSMITSYFSLNSGDYSLPKKAEDIRKIYDEITKGEIEETELPDGKIFRKDVTYVLKKSGTGKMIHRGVIPENKIINNVTSLLELMNEATDIPHLLRVAIGHYYFGYIHPFYDGNGRTSRFISSMYMARHLGEVSAFSLSRGCNKFRNKYLDSFEITNSIKGRGELNYFIDVFLDIIVSTLEEMTSELKEKIELLKLAYTKIDDEPLLSDLNENYKSLFFVLAQNHFFKNAEGLTVKELAIFFNVSDATIRKRIRHFIDLELVYQIGEKPAIYKIKENYFES